MNLLAHRYKRAISSFLLASMLAFFQPCARSQFEAGGYYPNKPPVRPTKGELDPAAAEVYKDALPEAEWFASHDPRFLSILRDLAEIYSSHRIYDRAEALYQRALKLARESSTPDPEQIARCMWGLAGVYDDEQQRDKALPLMTQALQTFEALELVDTTEGGMLVQGLGHVKHQTGNCKEAQQLFARAIRIHEKSSGPDSDLVALDLLSFAACHTELGEFTEAEPLFKRAIAIRKKLFDPGNASIQWACEHYSDMLRKDNRADDAKRVMNEFYRENRDYLEALKKGTASSKIKNSMKLPPP